LTIADTSGFLALISADEDDHEAVGQWYESVGGPLFTTPLAVAEMDHMFRNWGGENGGWILRTNLGAGSLQVRWWPEALETTLRVAQDRPDVGLVDASLVALAEHLETTRIVTLDQRHFRTLRPLTGEGAFTLLPADAD
jgi:predicted nucleic acid-binding protein